MTYVYVAPKVETKDDIIKKIEIEAQNLMYFEYMKKDEAFREAKKYVEQKYDDIVQKLKSEGKY